MLKAKRFQTSDKDIFEAFEDGDFNVLIHVMNRKHNFKHGFSRQLANRFPEVVQIDLEQENAKGSVNGIDVSYTDKTKMIVNVYCIRNTPDENGSLISLKQLDAALSTLNGILPKKKAVVGFVKFGTGISKGNWDEISEVINDNLKCKGILFGQE